MKVGTATVMDASLNIINKTKVQRKVQLNFELGLQASCNFMMYTPKALLIFTIFTTSLGNPFKIKLI